MAKLVWDQIGDRVYEAGVSNGVFYDENGVGTAWNGLVEVIENALIELEESYFDGVKIADIATIKSFSGSIKAVTYPDELLDYEGTVEDQTGFYVTNQTPKQFSISYRTEIGDDISGLNSYKIHLLYNLTAIPEQKTNQSLGLSTDPLLFEWTVSAVPEEIYGYRPTAHIIIDASKMDVNMLADLEGILYGEADNDAFLPPLQTLATFIRTWERLIVIDNGDGTWTATSLVPGVITMLDATTFEINSDSAVFIDADSYTLESSEKNEGDIWLP